MTENRSQKQAIRQRMAETGEKYTTARRAVLGQTPSSAPAASAPAPLLFSQGPRTDPRPAGHEESSFAFMDRVANDGWGRVRDTLEAWFASYPAEAKADLAARFRSRGFEQHVGAWWELYLHQLLTRLGCRLSPHPTLETGSGHPDFLVETDDGDFYLEATAFASGIVDEDRHAKLEAAIYEIINKAKSDNFHVGVSFDAVGTERPRVAEIGRPLEAWLATLDPDHVSAEITAGQDPPSLSLPVRGWELVFEALPIKPENRGQAGRVLGMYPAIAGFVNDKEKAREALQRKRRRYRDPDKPLVIALLSNSSFFETDDVGQALFGSLGVQYRQNDPSYEARSIRQRDGFWMGERGPTAKKVSAVLHADGLLPWTATQKLPRLWLNPWATKPLRWQSGLATGASSDQGKISTAESSLEPNSVFGLASSWPGIDRAQRAA